MIIFQKNPKIFTSPKTHNSKFKNPKNRNPPKITHKIQEAKIPDVIEN